MRQNFLTITILFFFFTAHADVRLPKIFGDNMVLQRDQPITIWGWADPKEKITIQINKQTKNVTAGKDGTWKISLASETHGGPYQLIVKGKNTITFSNVLIGDVWVCSGQSNMEWPVSKSNQAMAEIAQANYPQIRHFKVPRTMTSLPLDDVTGGEWKVCSPETAGDFTAVGYFFARELTQELNVPIGLLHTTWGGTHVETWTSREAFEASEEFKNMIANMPRLPLDSIAKQKRAEVIERMENLQGAINSSPAVSASWKELSFDDSSWKKMKVPGFWEQQSLGIFDGVVWFRKTIELSTAEAGKEAMLEIGKVDDSDETFVNGVKVGDMKGKRSANRIYMVPAGILKKGINVITVRVEDNGGTGGIYGLPEELKLTVGIKPYPLAGEWSFRVESISYNSLIGPNTYPTLLFNGMVNPLIPFSIKGAIWYQGESNAVRAHQYRKAFPLMINDWRSRWGIGNFPFYFVQLASFNSANGNSKAGSTWAELREAQAMTLSLPNTSMVVTTDIGEPNDIHPRNKQDVGKRLAAVALHGTYGKNNVWAGPQYQSLKVEGNKAIISFTNPGTGLTVKDKYGYLKGFEVAGADQQFYYAKAYIEGDKVVVYHENVQQPVAIRYGWADDAGDNNLFNLEGFPAPPFRTDNWKGITEETKFTITN